MRYHIVVAVCAILYASVRASAAGTCDANAIEQCVAASEDVGFVPGVNGIPLQYIVDMAKFALPNFSWLRAFCDGDMQNCTLKRDFPGPQVVGPTVYETVRELGAQLPRMEWSGKWWRGNELGTLINTPYYYYARAADNSSVLSPLSIALGITPKQHAAVRPVFERAFDFSARLDEIRPYIRQTAAELIARRTEKGELTHLDLKIWFHRVINKLTFDRDVSEQYAVEFYDMQAAMLSSQIISQALPRFAYGADPLKLARTRDKAQRYIDEYKQLLRAQYADLLDGRDCAPSASCLDQAAFGVFDAFLAAGGVSVPGTIFEALAVTYSTDASNPAGAPLKYTPDQALQMYWETVRIFPPVVVLPYWSPRPTCVGLTPAETAALNADHGQTAPCPLGAPNARTGFPAVNQYRGGVRYLPNIAMAMLDPSKWGAESTKFRLRPVDLYDKYSLGFAEHAVDNSVADGRMNRVCPGRALALLMGETFLRLFPHHQWMVNPNEAIKIKTGGPYVGDFKMYTKESVERCHKECGCDARGLLAGLRCRRCKSSQCAF